uniref:Carbonic anhydrase 4 n=1 Tax=Oreochromis niloticus TaxID=8128 RepID=A0A669B260_ORENI
IQIKGGNLDDEYKAIQFHLHWGKDGGRGSEHTIDGENALFHLQMHIVHIKEEYDSLAEASKDSTGVAVLGFFFQVLGKHNFKKLSSNCISNPLKGIYYKITQCYITSTTTQ